MLKKFIATSLPLPQRLIVIQAKRSGVIFKSSRVTIGYFSFLYGNVIVGDSVVFGQNTFISCNRKYCRLEIEENVRFGSSNKAMENHPHPKSVSKICEGTYIGKNNILDLTGGLCVGKGCILTDEIRVLTHTHEIPSRRKPVQTGKVVFKPVVIEDDVFIGVGAKILSGIRIEKGAIIGAGSVVTHDVEPYAFVAGIPAKKIGERRL